MTLEELPLFGMSVKLLKFWSFMLANNNWRHYLTIIPMILLILSQLGHILLTPEPIVVVIRNSYHLVLWSNTLLRGLNLVSKSDKYKSFLRTVSSAFFEIQRNEGVEMNNMMTATCKTVKTIGKANIVVATATVFGFGIYPLFARVRLLPYGAYIPGFDKYASPLYEFLYAFQFIITIPCSCVYIPFTNLFLAFILFTVLMNKVLKYHLSKLKDLPKKQIWREVIWCIQYQLKIIRFVKTINSLVTYIYLVEFIASGVLLCALLFLLNIVGIMTKVLNTKGIRSKHLSILFLKHSCQQAVTLLSVSSLGQLVIVVIYLAMTMTQLSVVYWFANELYFESTAVAVEAYNTNWFEFDLKTQKAILLIIARAQRPCAIMIGNIFPMTLETFQSLLNTTYSYFTLLRRFYE